MQVAGRVDERCGARARLARGLRRRGRAVELQVEQRRPVDDGADADARLANTPDSTRSEHAHIAEREVAVPQRELREPGAAPPSASVVSTSSSSGSSTVV